MQLTNRIAGIPCLVEVTRCDIIKGSYRSDAPSDWDYYGYSEIEFDVLDSKGYPAPWLERKMTRTDKERIEVAILDAYSDDCYSDL